MADLSDVVSALAALAAGAIYPNGNSNPPVAGTAVTVITEWPLPEDLDQILADFAASPSVPRAIVSVWPLDDEENVTKYASDWETLTPPPATTVGVMVGPTGHTITLSGTPTGAIPQNVGLQVNSRVYVHGVAPGDTVASIAGALAALVNADTPASAAGAVITVPAAWQLQPRTGTAAVLARETRRTRRTFQLACAAPSPALRDRIGAAIDAALADMQWLALDDGSGGRLVYRGSPQHKDPEKIGIYWRGPRYSVEYPTIVTQLAPQLLFAVPSLAVGPLPTKDLGAASGQPEVPSMTQFLDTTAGPLDFVLPSDHSKVSIKDVGMMASLNNITVSTLDGAPIEAGAGPGLPRVGNDETTFVIRHDGAFFTFEWNGGGWSIE